MTSKEGEMIVAGAGDGVLPWHSSLLGSVLIPLCKGASASFTQNVQISWCSYGETTWLGSYLT